MKQRISPDQLNELTPSQQEKLREWWKPEESDTYVSPNNVEYVVADYPFLDKKDYLPLLNIGQCIELLREKDIDALGKEFWYCAYEIEDEEYHMIDEMIDRLWEAVKSIL